MNPIRRMFLKMVIGFFVSLKPVETPETEQAYVRTDYDLALDWFIQHNGRFEYTDKCRALWVGKYHCAYTHPKTDDCEISMYVVPAIRAIQRAMERDGHDAR